MILSFDIGTSAMKAGLLDENGRVHALASQRMTLHAPAAGAAEHDPDELMRAVLALGGKVAGTRRRDVRLIVIASYQFGAMLLDKAMRPLTGITTLLDTRAQEASSTFYAGLDTADIYRRSACPPFFQYPLARLHYFRQAHPELYARAAHVLSCKDYLLYRLTGALLTEPSTASATQLMNAEKAAWDEQLLGLVGLGREQLPPIVEADAEQLPLLLERGF